MIQATVDEARLLGCPEDEDTDEAQCLLDKARELAAERPPLDCDTLCATLFRAYEKATERAGESLECYDEDEDID